MAIKQNVTCLLLLPLLLAGCASQRPSNPEASADNANCRQEILTYTSKLDGKLHIAGVQTCPGENLAEKTQ